MAVTLSGDSSLALPEFDQPPAEPVGLLQAWVAAAEAAGVREPRAATLATADAEGRVSARTLLIKDIGPAGVLMGFVATSRKGRDLAQNPHGAVNLYWRERLQQITIAGKISRAADEVSDRLFADRTRDAQAVAATSLQSQPMPDPATLHHNVDQLANSTQPIPRPADWAAWILSLDEVEFWHGSVNRFHRRLHYRRTAAGYQVQRLQP
ncbi:pyridoxal 5'-phosphate synthase [Microlunatus speluncae]|uniref:pyridoxal 5'-phosphate synthase n=1 Tax=Microlunatus speluncae TaxID=2594267 RepID=UPI0012668215|nr:pyridoxal 5'-phosphate synthase [Microlunatus speluncae]